MVDNQQARLNKGNEDLDSPGVAEEGLEDELKILVE
jgi:hypothetical protein